MNSTDKKFSVGVLVLTAIPTPTVGLGVPTISGTKPSPRDLNPSCVSHVSVHHQEALLLV